MTVGAGGDEMNRQARPRPTEIAPPRRTSDTQLLARYRLAFDLAREVNSTLDVDEVMDRTIDLLIRETGAERGFVMFREGNGQLVPHALRRIDPAQVNSEAFRVSRTITKSVLRRGEHVLTSDALADKRFSAQASVVALGLRSILAAPLIVKDVIEGVVYLDDTRRPNAFSEADVELVCFLSEIIAIAIQNARTYRDGRELEQLKADFVARVSHELRTPLTIMAGLVTTLIDHGERLGADERNSMLERTLKANERLDRLLMELLAAASIEAELMSPRKSWLDVGDLLRGVAAKSSKPELVTVRCPAGCEISTDPVLVRRALALLVENSIRFAGDAELSAAEDAGLEIAVRDRGPGVPEDIRDRIFEQFVRGNHSEPGMGLGLFLVRTICESLGAEVRLEHPADGGARFAIRFPRVPD
jgi:K+-sensing histidine kinase KdpD